MKWLKSFLFLPLIVLSQTDLSLAKEQQAIKQAETEVSRSKHTEAEISQSKQKAIIPQIGTEKELEEKPKDMKHLIGPAWQYYEQGNYKQAAEIFTTLSSFPETELDAKYGLAMCYIKLKESKKAIPLLKSLVKARFDLKNTLPAILTLLVEEKEYKKAETYLVMLEEKERQKWEEIIKTKLLFSEFDEFKKTGNAEKIVELTEANNELLKKCLSPDLFYEAAGAVLKDNKEYAIGVYKNLLQSCRDKKDLRLGVLYSLKSILPSSDMISLLSNEESRKLDSDYKDKINELKISVLMDKLTSLPPDSPELEDTVREILILKPEEEGARTMLAWWYYNKGEYEKAYQEFYYLYQRSPETKDYIYGLVNTLIKLKRFDEALELASKNKKHDERLAVIEAELRLSILRERFAVLPPDSKEIEKTANEILALKPDDEGTMVMLAWWYYNKGEYEKAYQEFYYLYQRSPETKDYIYGLVNALIKLNKTDEALELARKNKEYDERLTSVETDIRLSILGSKLTALPPDSPELENTIREILALKPDDEGTMVMLAWWYYNKGEYEKAYQEFYYLYQRSP
ncbi:MAG TPA: tetratricopeptide repeat protein, partial [Thermodesulfovibrionia bacterium]|nr:tetratricopeptide repeat protein [Thermodesulfovibrionia bacterium]